MSQIKSVNTINREIERLNTQYDAMVQASEAFIAFQFHPDLFDCYSEYHSLLTNFSNHLITKSPFLPNNNIPDNNPLTGIAENPNIQSLAGIAGIMKNNEMSVVKGLILFLPCVPMFAVTAMKIIPWIIPVLYSAVMVAFFCGPQLIEGILNLTKKKDEEPNLDTTNPSEWISKELQVLSDKYDAIRILILRQDTKPERLATGYRKKDEALFRRLEQEKQFFPNECLSVVRKIMVFCTNAYYEIKDDLISHLPVVNPPSSEPSMRPNQ